MIAGIRGTIEEIGTDSLIVQVGGLSLRAFAPLSTLSQVGRIGDTVHLHTHFYVREDQLSLYGFSTREERELFQLLLGVSGVGPRAALALLSRWPAPDLAQAIARGDTGLLTRVPGIGAKTAARLVLELQGRVAGLEMAGAAAAVGDAEVQEALAALGFGSAEVQEALRALDLPAGAPVEEKLGRALAYLGRGR